MYFRTLRTPQINNKGKKKNKKQNHCSCAKFQKENLYENEGFC